MPRRVWILLLAAGLVAAPAAVLRGFCAGRSCERPAEATAAVPFCSLPRNTQRLLQAGFHESRSPEVLAVARRDSVFGGSAFGRPAPAWPSLDSVRHADVPVVFWGSGISSGPLPGGFSLDDVAPTLAEVIGLDRPHPEVRSGTAAEGVASGPPPRLVLEVIWKGIGSSDLEVQPRAWPFLARLLRSGAGTTSADVGSLPLEPTAVLTTIGSGGLPHQHGITGTLVRDDRGRLVRAWGRGAPPSVIATLADDLDQDLRQRPRVTLVARRVAHRGLIGGNWYVDSDRDRVVIGPRVTAAALRELRRGVGGDGVVDLLAVVDSGPLRALDDRLRSLAHRARRAARGAVAVVVAGTGSTPASADAFIPAERVVEHVERRVAGVVEGVAPGGLFLDDSVLARRSLSADAVVRALRSMTAEGSGEVFADAFPSLAVSLGRYCG